MSEVVKTIGMKAWLTHTPEGTEAGVDVQINGAAYRFNMNAAETLVASMDSVVDMLNTDLLIAKALASLNVPADYVNHILTHVHQERANAAKEEDEAKQDQWFTIRPDDITKQ